MPGRNAVASRKDWVKWPDIICTRSGLSCFDLGQLIYRYLRRGSAYFKGIDLRQAFHQDMFDETTFSAAWDCAMKQIRIDVHQEQRLISHRR